MQRRLGRLWWDRISESRLMGGFGLIAAVGSVGENPLLADGVGEASLDGEAGLGGPDSTVPLRRLAPRQSQPQLRRLEVQRPVFVALHGL